MIIDWISACEKLSDGPLDSRLIGMKLWAMLHQQREMFHECKNQTSPVSLEVRQAALLENAKQCSQIVLNASAVAERKALQDILDDPPLDVAFFVQATKAWEFVATIGLDHKDPKLKYEALSEMISLLVAFENLLKAVRPFRGITFRSSTPLNAQLEHMISNAQQFFVVIVAQLVQHHDLSDRSEVLLLIEKMTRAIGEFEEIQDLNVGRTENGKMDMAKRLLNLERSTLSEDHFEYQMKDASVHTTSRHAFLWQVVKFLDQASKERESIHDIARLCHLVKEVGTSRQNATRLVECVDDILHRVRVGNNSKKRKDFKKKDSGSPRNVKGVGSNKPSPRLRSPSRRRKTTTNVTKRINGAM
jgi:hypothetical protein